MTTRQLFTNNAISLLAAPIGPSDTTLTVLPGYGALFPQPAPGGTEYFNVTLENQSATQREIIKVYGRTGDTFTNIVRAQEGTTAQSWPAGGMGNDTLVDHRVTAETMRRLQHESNFGQPTQGTVSVIVGATEDANVLPTNGPNKTCKWIVTIQTDDGRTCMVEVLAVYKAPPASPIFGQYAKVGDNISFRVHVTSTVSDMTLAIENTDTSVFTSVDVIRLQHYQ
jgi:hypothetical protein